MTAVSTIESVGVWLVGARGSIGAMTIASLALMAEREVGTSGLVTARPEFAHADLVSPVGLVVSGHDVSDIPLIDTIRRLWKEGKLEGDLNKIGDRIVEVEARLKNGVRAGEFPNDVAAVAQLRHDLDEFKTQYGLSRLIVINVASTEQHSPEASAIPSYESLRKVAEKNTVLAASSLYAWAAFEGGDAFIDFTPSQGFRLPALLDLAQSKRCLYMGSDGKTGETLVKSILVELFRRRNLQVDSWFGQNILGNRDGATLSDPYVKVSKVKSKDRGLRSALGDAVDSRVGIDYVKSLGEWKIAWDFIRFTGFLGCGMNMQFTWTGYDSVLATPLVIDLIRLTDLAMRRGERGAMPFLAPFFKDPFGIDEFRLVSQDEALLAWLQLGQEACLVAEGHNA